MRCAIPVDSHFWTMVLCVRLERVDGHEDEAGGVRHPGNCCRFWMSVWISVTRMRQVRCAILVAVATLDHGSLVDEDHRAGSVRRIRDAGLHSGSWPPIRFLVSPFLLVGSFGFRAFGIGGQHPLARIPPGKRANRAVCGSIQCGNPVCMNLARPLHE